MKKAVVVFSGGQDSTTCLVQALALYDEVHAITFDYGQRHREEIETARRLAGQLGIAAHKVMDVTMLGELAVSALTRDDIPVSGELQDNGLPNTFVPGRNLLFFQLAAAVGYRRGLHTLVGGMCETDFSGYPDCRDDTLKALQVAVSLGMGQRFTIETPLMWLDKAQTWDLARTLGGDALVDIVLEQSHTCYHGVREERHAWGYGCGTCPACALRKAGFERWNATLAR